MLLSPVLSTVQFVLLALACTVVYVGQIFDIAGPY